MQQGNKRCVLHGELIGPLAAEDLKVAELSMEDPSRTGSVTVKVTRSSDDAHSACSSTRTSAMRSAALLSYSRPLRAKAQPLLRPEPS